MGRDRVGTGQGLGRPGQGFYGVNKGVPGWVGSLGCPGGWGWEGLGIGLGYSVSESLAQRFAIQ